MQRFQTALRNKNVWQRVAVFDAHHASAAARREASVAMSARAFSSLPDHEVVGLPALSPTMEVGTIAKWNKQEGDLISAATSCARPCQQFTQQKLEVPHYHLSTNLTLDKLLDARARLNAGRGEDEQLSVNDFIVRAASLAMRKVPDANSSWKGSFIRQFNDVNVNLMVSSAAGGVVAPVLAQVNRKGLDDISKEIQAAVAKANDGAFEAADLANGTFTISNVGQFDVQSLAGIVRPEQACLLGLGTIEKKVVPNDDPNAEQIYKYAQVMTATLACDHRVIDGAVGAQWLATFKELVEDPLKMIL
ncbi:hypothetical protein PF003_g37908 [Phytophthora fragariae]|nr:hypothetical protein PF003_g40130 [Phytophthora fragariae]KAE8878087.1 hypothetical protein PF003_g37908 [Phytophthora fragariae]